MPQNVRGLACNARGGLSFRWTAMVVGGDNTSTPLDLSVGGNQAATPTLVLAPGTLQADTTLVVGFQACYAASPDSPRRACASATASYAVAQSPLVAALSGVNTVVGSLGPAQLDCGRGSFDPDNEPGALSYAWACAVATGGACLGSDSRPLVFAPNSPTQSVSLLRTPGGLRYQITCTVSKGSRQATASGFLVARALPLPLVAVDGLGGQPAPKVSPTGRVVLRGNVTSSAPVSLRVRWVQAAGPPVNLSDTVAVAATPLSAPVFAFRPNALLPRSKYVFNLTAEDIGGVAYAEVPLTTSGAPRGVGGAEVGRMDVSAAGPSAPVPSPTAAASGVAFSTLFTFSAADWSEDEDGPLLYQFQYTIEGAGARAPTVILSSFKPVPAVTTMLPPGIGQAGSIVTVEM